MPPDRTDNPDSSRSPDPEDRSEPECLSATFEWTPRGLQMSSGIPSLALTNASIISLPLTKSEYSSYTERKSLGSPSRPQTKPLLPPARLIRSHSSSPAAATSLPSAPLPPPQRKQNGFRLYSRSVNTLIINKSQEQKFPQTALPDLQIRGLLLVTFHDNYFVQVTSDSIRVNNKHSSQLLWQKDALCSFAKASNGCVFVGGTDGLLEVLKVEDGSTVLSDRTHSSPIRAILIENSTATVISEDGMLSTWDIAEFQRTAIQKLRAEAHFAQHIKKQLWLGNGQEITIYSLSDGKYKLQQALALSDLCQPGSPAGPHKMQQSGFAAFANAKLTAMTIFQNHAYCGLDNGVILKVDDNACALTATSVSSSAISSLRACETQLFVGLKNGESLVLAPRDQRLYLAFRWLNPYTKSSSARSTIEAISKIDCLVDQDLLVLYSSSVVFSWKLSAFTLNSSPSSQLSNNSESSSGRQLKVSVFTWNVNCANPNNLSTKFFETELVDERNQSDIIVINLQEVVDLEDKSKTARQLVKGGSKDSLHDHERWTYFFDSVLAKHGYQLCSSQSLVGLHSCVFVLNEILGEISNKKESVVKTGLGGFHGNKGGLLCSFKVFDRTLCLVDCHLAAGASAIIQRNRDAEAILNPKDQNAVSEASQSTESDTVIYPLNHDYCFFAGDTNYRINTAREMALRYIKAEDWESLHLRDQLATQLFKNPNFVLSKFSEAPLRFAPTYKFNTNTDTYDTSDKKRVPAWCDRVMYLGNNIDVNFYGSLNIFVSDHKPVLGVFTISL